MQLIWPDGHTVIEAAHLIPWSQTRNDDIRNGLALCRTCHWGFDEGILGVLDNFTVITARTLVTDPNVPGLLSMLSGRGIIPPTVRDHWPARKFLGEHRRVWRL